MFFFCLFLLLMLFFCYYFYYGNYIDLLKFAEEGFGSTMINAVNVIKNFLEAGLRSVCSRIYTIIASRQFLLELDTIWLFCTCLLNQQRKFLFLLFHGWQTRGRLLPRQFRAFIIYFYFSTPRKYSTIKIRIIKKKI